MISQDMFGVNSVDRGDDLLPGLSAVLEKVYNPPPEVKAALLAVMDQSFKMMERPLFPSLNSTPYTTDEPDSWANNRPSYPSMECGPYTIDECSCSNPACDLPNGMNCRNPL